jgi:hypothetical protein
MRGTSSSSDAPIDSLRLTDAQWLALADRLDGEAASHSVGNERRRHERVAYRSVIRLAIAVEHPSGDKQKYLVRSHDLSASGIGFFHGSYMHVGTKIILLMTHRQTGARCVVGVVRRCAHVSQRIHKVGVEFNEPIVLEDFAFETVQRTAPDGETRAAG